MLEPFNFFFSAFLKFFHELPGRCVVGLAARCTVLIYFYKDQFIQLLSIRPLTRQSLCSVLTRAPYVSWSSVRPSGISLRKSRSLKVGLDFSLSFLDARRLYVEPFKSNLRCMRTERGRILFITTTLMFFPPHWTQ